MRRGDTWDLHSSAWRRKRRGYSDIWVGEVVSLFILTLITTSTPITILLLLYYTATITTNYSLWCLTQPCRD